MAKILIIDDEVHIIELAKLYLQRDGFQVEYATKGQDGLAMWASVNPDLVILISCCRTSTASMSAVK